MPFPEHPKSDDATASGHSEGTLSGREDYSQNDGLNSKDTFWDRASAPTSVVANCVTALSVFVAVGFGITQYIQARAFNEAQAELQKSLQAQETYRSYVDRWLEHPELNCYDASLFEDDGILIENRSLLRKRLEYEAFASYVGTAIEEILLAFPNDKEWRSSLKYDVKRHLPYFELPFSEDVFDTAFIKLVSEARSEIGSSWSVSNCIE